MPEDHLAPDGADTTTNLRRWYQRPGIAAAAFLCAALALVVAVATAPDDPLPRVAQSPLPAPGASLLPSPTPAGTSEVDAEPLVLGAVEEATPAAAPDDGADTNPLADAASTLADALTSIAVPTQFLEISVGGEVVSSQQIVPTAIVNGAVRAVWTLDGAGLAAIGGSGQFITLQLSFDGPVGFDRTADAVLDIRCIGGNCPVEWSDWTPLPAGVVEADAATTLVARSQLARPARFELRPHPDPTIYVIS